MSYEKVEGSELYMETFECHCVWGWLFVSFVGAACHFLYALSHCSWVVGLLVAVNESVFEHLKLLIFPILIWWLIIIPAIWAWEMERPVWMRFYAGGGVWNSFELVIALSHASAACAGVLSGTVFIALVFLFVNRVCGYEALWLDILIFVAAAFVAQWAAWSALSSFLKGGRLLNGCDALLIVVILGALLGMYLSFTDRPPQGPGAELIFQDTSDKNNTFYGRPATCKK